MNGTRTNAPFTTIGFNVVLKWSLGSWCEPCKLYNSSFDPSNTRIHRHREKEREKAEFWAAVKCILLSSFIFVKISKYFPVVTDKPFTPEMNQELNFLNLELKK